MTKKTNKWNWDWTNGNLWYVAAMIDSVDNLQSWDSVQIFTELRLKSYWEPVCGRFKVTENLWKYKLEPIDSNGNQILSSFDVM